MFMARAMWCSVWRLPSSPLTHTPWVSARVRGGEVFMCMMSLMLRLTCAAAALTACSDHHAMDHTGGGGEAAFEVAFPEVIALPPTEGPFEALTAQDTAPSPEVVEVSLEARAAEVEVAPGWRVSMWTYNGSLPGPTIEARVGDTVRVRFRNGLPEATTIHWHGLRVPASMDGTHLAHTPIEPGAEFVYEFVVPEAGTFWYHPHLRSQEQVERGLYGALIVRAPGEPEAHTERVVVLDDLLVREDRSLAEFSSLQDMSGRQGNLILVNGKAHPIAPMTPGALHRFRFINAANARFFRLSLPGYRLVQIGTDGGLMSAPLEVSELLLVPGERADLLAVATEGAAQAVDWLSLPYERGHGSGQAPPVALFQARVSGDPPPARPLAPPEALPLIEGLPEPTLRRLITLEESVSHSAHSAHSAQEGAGVQEGAGEVSFSINGQVYPNITPLQGKLGDVEEWSIKNTAEMDHPFHLHGFRFQVVGGEGPRAWRDTINIPAKQTVSFRVRLEDHPGSWMFHCHILEHAERGMVGELVVLEE